MISAARGVHETAWRNRIVGHGEEAPDQLLANPANWRLHPREQQQALAGALAEVGWVAAGPGQPDDRARRRRPSPSRACDQPRRADGAGDVRRAQRGGGAAGPRHARSAGGDGDGREGRPRRPCWRASSPTTKPSRRCSPISAIRTASGGHCPAIPTTSRPSRTRRTSTSSPATCGCSASIASCAATPLIPTPSRACSTAPSRRLLATDPPYGVSLDPTWRDGVYNELGPAEQPYMRDRGPPQHDPVGRHPGRLVRGLRARPLARGRLRLARRRPRGGGRRRPRCGSASRSPPR